MESVAILGASRGLGLEILKVVALSGHHVTGFSRKPGPAMPNVTYEPADFSKEDDQLRVIQKLEASSFSRIFIVAGGGPYGEYGQKQWKDHKWAWEVTFLFPARVLHALQKGPCPQVILIGSSVAESAGDPGAASYASAKHALKGLFSSLIFESPGWDIRLFSPGYMDTEMLPPNAPIRKKGVWPPAEVAKQIWRWSLEPDKGGHRVQPKHPSC